MKNFFQFLIPLLVIGGIGFFLMKSNDADNGEQKLYVKCNNNSQKFKVVSDIEIDFAEGDEACHLKMKIENVDQEYLRFSSAYLWRLNPLGEIDETEPRAVNFVQANEEVTLYSFDKKTKYTFEYK